MCFYGGNRPSPSQQLVQTQACDRIPAKEMWRKALWKDFEERFLGLRDRNKKEECLFPSLMLSRLDKMSELAAILLLAETYRSEGGNKKNSSLLDDVAKGLYRTNFNSLFLHYTTCTIPSFTVWNSLSQGFSSLQPKTSYLIQLVNRGVKIWLTCMWERTVERRRARLEPA